MNDGTDIFIALQNIAYRITANVVRGDTLKVSDTITMLIPKRNMSILELKYIVNYLNSSVAFYNLHINCLNNSRLTIHMDKYYIEDIKVPIVNSDLLSNLDSLLNGHEKTKEVPKIRNGFFYDVFSFDIDVINEIEKIWTVPRYKLKVGRFKNG